MGGVTGDRPCGTLDDGLQALQARSSVHVDLDRLSEVMLGTGLRRVLQS